MDTDYHSAKILDIKELSPNTRQFFIQYPFEISFKSGQFVIIDFGKINHQFSTRSYSIADFTDKSILELCVVLKEDGAATPLLFDSNIGDSIMVSIPQGRFVLPEILEETPIVFICTGTGVAPFRTMIKDLLLHRHFKSQVYLFFGCRTKNDILYYNEFCSLSEQYSNFDYIPVLSREQWEGETGYVHPHYLKLFSDHKPALFYLCGWTEMIKETRNNLKEIGYTRSEIKVEFYD
jgi:NAD(P)H-flavin reductase